VKTQYTTEELLRLPPTLPVPEAGRVLLLAADEFIDPRTRGAAEREEVLPSVARDRGAAILAATGEEEPDERRRESRARGAKPSPDGVPDKPRREAPQGECYYCGESCGPSSRMCSGCTFSPPRRAARWRDRDWPTEGGAVKVGENRTTKRGRERFRPRQASTKQPVSSCR
jgi:hypothetical protein